MKRLLVVVGIAGLGAALVAGRVARGWKGFDFEKMVERMPENAPPRWMFENVGAIRANSERILELLEAGQLAQTREHARTGA